MREGCSRKLNNIIGTHSSIQATQLKAARSIPYPAFCWKYYSLYLLTFNQDNLKKQTVWSLWKEAPVPIANGGQQLVSYSIQNAIHPSKSTANATSTLKPFLSLSSGIISPFYNDKELSMYIFMALTTTYLLPSRQLFANAYTIQLENHQFSRTAQETCHKGDGLKQKFIFLQLSRLEV